jgi:16S rRNA (uracil1498-N3)-methyltransferase
MSLRVFHEAGGLADGETVVLDAEESHYLVRVRRASKDTSLDVIDGDGGIWRATLVHADANAAKVRIDETLPVAAPSIETMLLLGMPDPGTTLEVVGRCCETGVDTVVLTLCARSQGKAPGEARIRRVLRSSQRQCGRPTAPTVVGPVGLGEALALRADLAGFFAWEGLRGQPTIRPRLAGEEGVRLLVGPEGGLQQDEVELARSRGLVAVALGPWTLRTDTAALVGLGWLMGARASA